MNIKMLLPACEESRRLIDWVEEGACGAAPRTSAAPAQHAPPPILCTCSQWRAHARCPSLHPCQRLTFLPTAPAGVYDAIRRSYLKTLFFGISTDPEGTNLLEVRG